jgi:hypothetical protein
MEERNVPSEELRNPDVHHEERDVNPIFLTKFGIGLAFALLIILFGLWFLFDYFLHREEKKGPMLPSRVTSNAIQPPEPRLQATPVLDLQAMRAAEDQLLDNYRWVDPDRGIVSIPIDRAIDIIAQRGLPARRQSQPQLTEAEDAGVSESGVGRPRSHEKQ